jgi:8-amino-7-oxononanoate synthase
VILTDLKSLIHQRLEADGAHRTLKSIETYGTRTLNIKSGDQLTKTLNFASNDYLGLSEKKSSLNFKSQPSSRLLSGNLEVMEQLEIDLAQYVEKESATILSSGYTANLGMISSLANKGDLVLADYSIHASLIDGMRLSSAEWKRFKHNDLEDLEKRLSKYQRHYKSIWVIVEGLYSMDGDLAPLKELVALRQKYSFFIVLDEAHSFGVYGENGKGLASEMGVLEHIDVMMFNFSKSLAMQGGVIVGPSNLKEYLVNKCRPLIYSTATPWSNLELLPERLDLLKKADIQRGHLKDICLYAQELFQIKSSFWSPVIPIHIGEHALAQDIAAHLMNHGIYCPAILPPTVPENKARLRISLTALHQKNDLEILAREIKKMLKGAT